MCIYDDKQDFKVIFDEQIIYLEMDSILEEASNKVTVSMHFYSIPTGIRDHNGCHTLAN